MAAVTLAKTIRRPMTQVFDFVADMRNDPLWAPMVSGVEQVAGDGPGQGARWRYRQQFGRRSTVVEIEMTQYQRPALLQWQMQNRLMDYEATMIFAPHAQGTRLRQTNVERLKGPWWLPFVAGPLIRRALRRQLRLLKKHLEKPPLA